MDSGSCGSIDQDTVGCSKVPVLVAVLSSTRWDVSAVLSSTQWDDQECAENKQLK